ncbi:MAG: hypothetical protein DI539_23415 [Flavobacterium psychrophilum]|nr:MAG: hypothetical protein DI539_23415 [Flavobacterium psychrophilum]
MIRKKLMLATVLCILLSITSSYKVSKVNLWQVYEVWGICPEQVWNPYFSPPDYADLYPAINEVLYYGTASITNLGYANLEDYRRNYSNGELWCSPNNEFICMAYVIHNFTNPNEGYVLDLLEGDFEHFE